MYYTDEDGAALTGWQKLKGPDGKGKTNLYYFNKRGKLFVPDGEGTYRVRKVNGVSYCFSEDGAAQTGWVNIADTAGRKDEPITDYRYFNTDGSMRTGWYSLRPPADYDGKYRYDVVWFCFDRSGKPYAAKGKEYKGSDLVKMNGKTYLFDRNGTPVSGFAEVRDIESEPPRTFFFGTRKQCFLQTGKRKITGSDGKEHVYYFRSTGRGMTGVHENMLYYRGRRQSADSGKTLYRIVTIPEEDGTKGNYLIDADGRVRKNAKVKDKDGTLYETDPRGILLKINGDDVKEGRTFDAPAEPDADPEVYL
jgi:glucan-binding YG repeat protein